MPKTKKIVNNITATEKLLGLSGLFVILLTLTSGLFYTYTNIRFIHDLPSIVYYLSYLVLLCGGFVIGILAIRHRPLSRYARLFAMVCYSLLAVSIYSIYELLRIFTQNSFGTIDYPYAKYIFELGPLIALTVTAILSYVTRKGSFSHHVTHPATYWLLIGTFIAYQLYRFGEMLFIVITRTESFDMSYTPFWLSLIGFVLQPIVILAVAYLSLIPVKTVQLKLLYAVVIGSLSALLLDGLWYFRIDASYASTLVTQAFISLIVLIATTLLILKTRSAAK